MKFFNRRWIFSKRIYFYPPKRGQLEWKCSKQTYIFQFKRNLKSKHGIFSTEDETFLSKLLFPLNKDPFEVVNMEFFPLKMKRFQAKIIFQLKRGPLKHARNFFNWKFNSKWNFTEEKDFFNLTDPFKWAWIFFNWKWNFFKQKYFFRLKRDFFRIYGTF